MSSVFGVQAPPANASKACTPAITISKSLALTALGVESAHAQTKLSTNGFHANQLINSRLHHTLQSQHKTHPIILIFNPNGPAHFCHISSRNKQPLSSPFAAIKDLRIRDTVLE